MTRVAVNLRNFSFFTPLICEPRLGAASLFRV
jgi:hypothetical protein